MQKRLFTLLLLVFFIFLTTISCNSKDLTEATNTETVTTAKLSDTEIRFLFLLNFVMVSDDVRGGENNCELGGKIIETWSGFEINGYSIIDYEFINCKMKNGLVENGSESIDCNNRELTINGKLRFTYDYNEHTEKGLSPLMISGTQTLSGMVNLECKIDFKLNHYIGEIYEGTICGNDVVGLHDGFADSEYEPFCQALNN